MAPRKKLAICTPCYNEEEGIAECYEAVRDQLAALPQYDYEHLYRQLLAGPHRRNSQNDRRRRQAREGYCEFAKLLGLGRSPYYGLIEADGDAYIPIFADSQTPPNLDSGFCREMEQGFKMVAAVRLAETAVSLRMRMARWAFV